MWRSVGQGTRRLALRREALEVQLDSKRLTVMEVSQHIGNNCVRCVCWQQHLTVCARDMDMEVVATSSHLRALWGPETQARPVQCVKAIPWTVCLEGPKLRPHEKHWGIHRQPPL